MFDKDSLFLSLNVVFLNGTACYATLSEKVSSGQRRNSEWGTPRFSIGARRRGTVRPPAAARDGKRRPSGGTRCSDAFGSNDKLLTTDVHREITQPRALRTQEPPPAHRRFPDRNRRTENREGESVLYREVLPTKRTKKKQTGPSFRGRKRRTYRGGRQVTEPPPTEGSGKE